MNDDISKNRSECVGCDFAIFSDSQDMQDLTGQLGVIADWSLPPAASTFHSTGAARSSGRRGCWLVRSKDRLASKDVNEHLRFLLRLLLPHRDIVKDTAKGGVAVFTVHWTGQAYPYDCGPAIAVDCVAGIAELNAELALTIHGAQ